MKKIRPNQLKINTNNDELKLSHEFKNSCDDNQGKSLNSQMIKRISSITSPKKIISHPSTTKNINTTVFPRKTSDLRILNDFKSNIIDLEDKFLSPKDNIKNFYKSALISPVQKSESKIFTKISNNKFAKRDEGKYYKNNNSSIISTLTNKEINEKNHNKKDTPLSHNKPGINKQINYKLTSPKFNSSTANEMKNTNTNTNIASTSISSNSLSQVTTQHNSFLNTEIENNNNNKEVINISSLINNQNIPLSISNLSVFYPFYESTKCSTRSIGHIKGYAANTYQGIVRDYNEDRVSIILSIARPQNFFGEWPKCSFFGIFDGHGGSQCAEFLRDRLHTYVIKNSNFPRDPIEALKKGFELAESDFILNHALNKNYNVIDKSGSCAIVALIVENMCYIANVGDSRAIVSFNRGKIMNVMSNDHKPNEENENKRIIENGGKVYQTQTSTKTLNMQNIIKSNQILIGPYRVFPGRLSVSRTFGDVEAKIPKYGGIPGVVISTPEINSFEITDQSDFLVIGCDGIFDQLSNKDVLDCVWMTIKDDVKIDNIHSQIALGVDMIMKSSLIRRTFDNVSVLIIAFKNFENIFNERFRNYKVEDFTPQSKLYLCNSIENKENVILKPDIVNNYTDNKINITLCKNKPYKIITNEDSKYLLNSNTRFVDKLNDKKRRSLSPVNKVDIMSSNIDTISDTNYNSRNKITNSSIIRLSSSNYNKIDKFEIYKKIIKSPKNLMYKKIEEILSDPISKNQPRKTKENFFQTNS